jgi:cytochrome c6
MKARGAGGWRRALAAVAAWTTAAAALAADPGRGAELYRNHCASCHGAGGRPVLPGAPDLAQPTALLKPDLALLSSIRSGRGGMPGYAGQLRDREILDLVAHLRTFR